MCTAAEAFIVFFPLCPLCSQLSLLLEHSISTGRGKKDGGREENRVGEISLSKHPWGVLSVNFPSPMHQISNVPLGIYAHLPSARPPGSPLPAFKG